MYIHIRFRFGKQRPPKDSDNEDEYANLMHHQQSDSRRNSRGSDLDSAPLSRADSQTSIDSNEGLTAAAIAEKNRKASR